MVKIYQIHEHLFLSGVLSPAGLDQVASLGITAIINLVANYDYDPGVRFAYLHEGLVDGKSIPPQALARIYQFLNQQFAKSPTGKVLVHCGSGVSRSGGIVVGQILLENPTWNWDQAIAFVRQHRQVDPDEHIRRSVWEYVNSERKL